MRERVVRMFDNEPQAKRYAASANRQRGQAARARGTKYEVRVGRLYEVWRVIPDKRNPFDTLREDPFEEVQ